MIVKLNIKIKDDRWRDFLLIIKAILQPEMFTNLKYLKYKGLVLIN